MWDEIKAIPALLALLDISGCIITIDAMGTQTDIAARIVERGADYVLSLKANHPTLYQQVSQWFKSAAANGFEGIEYSHDQRVEGGHHRTENRNLWAVRCQSNRRTLRTTPMGWSANGSDDR